MAVLNPFTIQGKGVVIGIQLQNQRLQLRYGIGLAFRYVGQIFLFADIDGKLRGVGDLSVRILDVQLVFSKLLRYRNRLFVAGRLCHGRAFCEIFGIRRRQPDLVGRFQQASAVKVVTGGETHVRGQFVIGIRHNGLVDQIGVFVLQTGFQNNVVSGFGPNTVSVYILIQSTVGGCSL